MVPSEGDLRISVVERASLIAVAYSYAYPICPAMPFAHCHLLKDEESVSMKRVLSRSIASIHYMRVPKQLIAIYPGYGRPMACFHTQYRVVRMILVSACCTAWHTSVFMHGHLVNNTHVFFPGYVCPSARVIAWHA